VIIAVATAVPEVRRALAAARSGVGGNPPKAGRRESGIDGSRDSSDSRFPIPDSR
jgi:hypothetical protein